AAQPAAPAGGCQFQVASTASANTPGEETSEYQGISRASTPWSAARVTSSNTPRQQAGPRGATAPAKASPAGCGPVVRASPRNAASAATPPRQVSASMPVAAAMSPVSSG